MRRLYFVTALFLLPGAPGFAQAAFPPTSFKNLQVLPKDSPASAVITTMRGFATGLGVRCQFCHVGKEGLPLDQFDFVTDTMPQKTTARTMMRMTAELNRQLDAAIPRTAGAEPRVTCVTCHRGKSTPTTAPGQ